MLRSTLGAVRRAGSPRTGSFGLLGAVGLLLATVPAALAAEDHDRGPTERSETATLSGIRFMDRNGDGVHQTGEPGDYAYSVYLEKPDGTRVGKAEFTDDGRYVMKGIAPGDYVLVFPIPHQFLETTPRKVPVSLAAGDWKVRDYGVRGGEIAGVTWQDFNGDGQRQIEEPPAEGVRVDLRGSNQAGHTGPDGTYHFYDLPVNLEYQVVFGVRPETPFSPPLVGDEKTDSDVIDADEGKANARISVYKGQLFNDPHINAGYVPQAP